MFPTGALARPESGTTEKGREPALPRLAPNSGRMAEVVWVHDGAVCVTIVDEPRRGFHDNTCRCGGCQASRPADSAAYFLPVDGRDG